MTRVLFVCLGNICRSPLGEGILRRQAQERGIQLYIDSAGTGDYHIGELPDRRAIRTGEARGCNMTMRARQVRRQDFEEFDYILAMDRSNYATLLRWAGASADRVRMAMPDGREVPDPYYGDLQDFELVANLLEEACTALLDEIETKNKI